MSLLSALPGHPHEANPEAEALQRAFEDLPQASKSYVVGLVAHAWTHYEQTGDVAPLRHLTESLATTIQLRANARLQEAFAEGDAHDTASKPKSRRAGGVEVADFVEQMGKKYGV